MCRFHHPAEGEDMRATAALPVDATSRGETGWLAPGDSGAQTDFAKTQPGRIRTLCGPRCGMRPVGGGDGLTSDSHRVRRRARCDAQKPAAPPLPYRRRRSTGGGASSPTWERNGDPVYMSRKIRKFRTDKFVHVNSFM